MTPSRGGRQDSVIPISLHTLGGYAIYVHMTRRTISLFTLVVLSMTPLATLAAEVCEAHDLAQRMSEHESCADEPCCLSPATQAIHRDDGRRTTPAKTVVVAAELRRVPTVASRAQRPPHFDLPGLQAQVTTVLRC